jgi:hypothetical protein
MWQNENLRFLHLRMRDYFAFKYAQIALREGDPETRDRAAWALWEIPDERAVPLLIEALEDPYKYTRGSAAGALGRIGDARAIEPLRKMEIASQVFFVVVRPLGRKKRRLPLSPLLQWP